MYSQLPAIQPESRLIQLAAGGDLEAFNDLVLKYQDQVYRLAYAILREHDAAEDAAQDTFISAFQHIGGFRGGSFQGWLLRIATNTCYDVFRRLRRHIQTALYPEDDHGNEIESASWLADPGPTPQAEIERDELARTLYRRLDDLPGPYRVAITLVDLDGLDYAAAAQALGVPVGTVKSRLARARLRMRRTLAQQAEDISALDAAGAPICAQASLDVNGKASSDHRGAPIQTTLSLSPESHLKGMRLRRESPRGQRSSSDGLYP